MVPDVTSVSVALQAGNLQLGSATQNVLRASSSLSLVVKSVIIIVGPAKVRVPFNAHLVLSTTC